MLKIIRLLFDQPFQEVSYDDEEVRGEGVALTEARTTLEPAARGAVQEDGSASSGEKG
jgi:hypothetical protein